MPARTTHRAGGSREQPPPEQGTWEIMTRRFDGKVALITGGGTGIGAATARRIADEGGRVVLIGRREGPLKAVAEICGGLAVVGDTTKLGDIEHAVCRAQEEYGGIDMLVANAGIEKFGSVEALALEDWRRVFEVKHASAWSC